MSSDKRYGTVLSEELICAFSEHVDDFGRKHKLNNPQLLALVFHLRNMLYKHYGIKEEHTLEIPPLKGGES